ncbi:MAG: hypothetical protein R6U95_05875 [Bacteroidales bacterium]
MKHAKPYIIGFLIATAAITGLSFSETERSHIECAGISIHINGNDKNHKFIQDQDIYTIINSFVDTSDTSSTQRIHDIALYDIEKKIADHPLIESCNVYTTIDGIITIDITQRTPLIRIESKHDSFYIDKKGRLMPLSENYTSHTLLASGNIDAGYREKHNILLPDDSHDTILQDLFTIAQKITQNGLFSAIIEQVYVTSNNNFILVSKVGPPKIYLGTHTHLDYKLRNLTAFYHSKKARELWHSYSSINLKYKNQIVCTKK